MSLVSTVLNGARYDLRSYGDIDFDSDQLIHYLNRSIFILDYSLGSHNSDWVLNVDTVSLATSANSATVPTGTFNIREIWIDQDRKENVDQMVLYYKRKFRIDGETEPNFWSHVADSIEFEVDADDDYTVTVYYDKLSTEITAEGDTMPYDGRFDEHIREAVVLMAQSKKYKNPPQADAMYASIFESIVHHDALNRKFVKKTYRLDF